MFLPVIFFVSLLKQISYDYFLKPIYHINKGSDLMIDKTKIIDTVCERLQKLPIGHYIDLKTYKRNRTVIIVKIDEKKLLVIEDGYFKDRFLIKSDKLKKLLKTLLKKEFPRSRKIRLYVMEKFVDEVALNAKRKIL